MTLTNRTDSKYRLPAVVTAMPLLSATLCHNASRFATYSSPNVQLAINPYAPPHPRDTLTRPTNMRAMSTPSTFACSAPTVKAVAAPRHVRPPARLED